jgi:hypothetical protein
MDVENPLHVEIIPVATIVGIEVNSELLIEPKIYTRHEETTSNTNSEESLTSEIDDFHGKLVKVCNRMKFWLEISFIIMAGLAVFGAFISILILMCNPMLFGIGP